MGTDLMYEFDYMDEDTVCSVVSVYKGGNVVVKNLTDNIVLTAFGRQKNIGLPDVLELFEDRCVPESRANIKELLACIGLTVYDPLGIIKHTHGALYDDHSWIRFSHERGTLKWGDVNPRIKIRKACERYRKERGE